jgi:Xaa-Pro aminopeptidase
MKKFNLQTVQKFLVERQLNGWLICDIMGNDSIARAILGIDQDTGNFMRWFYFIPSQGAPVKLVHGIDSKILDHLPGKKIVYIGWKEMEDKLKRLFKKGNSIVVQYSPRNAIPSISKLDAGIYEILKSFNIKLVSSGDLIQQFEASVTKTQLNTHLNVVGELHQIIEKTFVYIKRKIQNHQQITELTVQKYIQVQLQTRGLISDNPPLVAVGEHTNDPHYLPSKMTSETIHTKSLIQISIQAKEKDENAVYASTTWMGYIGENIPDDYIGNFSILTRARDAVINYIQNSIKSGKIISGWKVDEFCRNVFEKKGLEGHYLHRTGHSIGKQYIAPGVTLDNHETKDDRNIMPGTCLAIAPGIYFSEYGMRTELNIYIDKNKIKLNTAAVQKEIVLIKPQK